MASLAVRTGTLPSQWEQELELDPRAVWTVRDLLNRQDRARERQGNDDNG